MAEPLVLLVIANGAFTTHPLPDAGEVVIGRSEGCDVRVDDRSLSRRHALLRVGPTLEIEDLGSANGTRLRDTDGPRSPEGDLTGEITDAPLAPGRRARFAPGDVFVLGTVIAIVQPALQLDTEAAEIPIDPVSAVPSTEPETPESAERSRILEALQRCAGNQTVAAKLLGISRRTLVTRLGELGIPRPRKARDLLG